MGKAEALGVQIATGIEVTGFVADHASSAIKEVVTDKDSIVCNQLVVAPGPGLNTFGICWNYSAT